MQYVYSSALLTISAAHSTGSSSGIFHPRNALLSRTISLCPGGDKRNPLFSRYLVPTDPDLSPNSPDIEPLYTRGWVLQEQVLYELLPDVFTTYHKILTK